MTELSIRPEEIRDALDNFVQSYEPGAASREEVGRVIDAGDGIAHVEGLPSAMTNELLRVRGRHARPRAQPRRRTRSVSSSSVTSPASRRARRSSRTGEVLSVPVGDAFLGRVVNPLGEPIDGLGEIEADDAPRPRAAGAHRRAAQVGARAAADRPQGRRRDDPDRSRPAPAHHR